MKKTFLVIAMVAIFASCGNEQNKQTENTENQSADNTEESVSETKSPSKIYDVKSGIYSYTTDAMGMKIITTIYFDSFGAREVKCLQSGGSIKMDSRAFFENGYAYKIDLLEKKVSKTKMPKSYVDSRSIAFFTRTKSEKERKMYDLKEEGTAEILGKTCKVYSSIGLANKRVKNYVYKGVVLKSELGGEAVLEASSFEEDADMPDWFYKIPDGFEVNESEMPDNVGL